MATQRSCEKWIWTELIGFDNTQEDLGVGEYINTAGFVPDTICLLLTSVDFILSYEDREGEYDLPADYCARDGHEFNQVRQRQTWTNRQLEGLIQELHARGVEVYLTVFTRFYGNRFHHEWLSDHREACRVQRGHGWVAALNPLSRLEDGSYFEDYFIPQLVRVMEAYDFDGWHGADGYGPLNGPVWDVPMSDDMLGQFELWLGEDLPDTIIGPCGHDVDALEERGETLWREYRHQWIEFMADRWAGFWQKAVNALHDAGKQAVINSAWGRAPFESLYRYGIDYRKIVDTGVDGIIVETVASGLSMDPRPECAVPSRHYDFLAMLQLIRAYVPDARLIFLHNVHDICEQWDAIRHNPTVLETDIYSLLNVYHTAPGALVPAADGFLACLGDAISECEWLWLRERWDRALSAMPRRCLGPTLVWSDALMHAQVADFTETRRWTVHRLLFHLLTRGLPVTETVRIEDVDAAEGAILAINPHLMEDDERQQLMKYHRGPVIVIGPDLGGLPDGEVELSDAYPPSELSLRVWNADMQWTPVKPMADETEDIPGDMRAVQDRSGYWDHMYFRKVSGEFLDACVAVVHGVSDAPALQEGGGVVTVMAADLDGGTVRLALKNKTDVYAEPVVDMKREIGRIDIVTNFPSVRIQPEGSTFSVRVPGKGITVVDVHLA
ncbi:MAG: hypothetical protein R6V19_01730 [Armatimonadota bacterium]